MKSAPLYSLLVVALFISATPTLRAEQLLIERARAASAQPNLPTRGQIADQVEKKFGAPQEKLEPRGGQKRQWPVINRWVYPEFTVYFERQRVINVVLNAGSQQVGSSDTRADGGWWDDQPASNALDNTELDNFTPGADGDAWEQDPIYADDDQWALPVE